MGKKITDVKYFEYREVFKVSLVIFEDGKPVYTQDANLSDFKKNSWRNIQLDEPYVIREDKDLIISIKYYYGRNMDFVAICDRSPLRNKGNLYSFDGEKWYDDAPGDFLITAILQNDATESPMGYNIYRDSEKINDELISGVNEYILKGESDGLHTYSVSAVYNSVEKQSVNIKVTTQSVYNYMPPVPEITGEVENLNCILSWNEPLRRGEEMTWSGKEVSNGIGGTSSTSPKVWIKQDFTQYDLAAFPNHQITAINSYIYNDGVINSVTAFIIKNGVIDYFEEIPSEIVSAIKPNEWNKFTLKSKYKLELGNEYSFGLYYIHTANGHPVGVDNRKAVEGKGNSFSTSSPSSKGFGESKPVWKTLSQGKIPGNFMLSADVEALSSEASDSQEVIGYDIYCNGELIAENIQGTTYTTEVKDLGTYTYGVIVKGEKGRHSEMSVTDVLFKLPEYYKSPTIIKAEQNGKDISISWSNNAYEMRHYSTAAYIAGFAEEMPLIYGAKFSKEELADYAGYKFKSMTFGIGENLDSFKLKVIAEGGELLYEKEFKNGEIESGYLYTLDFDDDENVRIPSGKDIYLAYDAVLPAKATPILLDEGPEVEGGAVVNLSGGVGTWINLGTIASDYKGMNIVISALIFDDSESNGKTSQNVVNMNCRNVGEYKLEKLVTKPNLKINIDDINLNINSVKEVLKVTDKSEEKLKVKGYRLYKNGSMIKETTSTLYNETLNDYGVFNYYITNVYENGWESNASDIMEFTNTISQRPQAPYDLEGVITGKDINLKWKPVTESPVLTYDNGSGNYMAFGMTGGDVVEGYMVSRFPISEISDKIGQEVSHITFRLNSTELVSAAIVVLYGDNIVYKQDIRLSTLSVGANTVRLDNSVPIIAGHDLGIGYFLRYNNGVKPLVCDDGPTVANYYSDLISSSGTPGYWKSMNADFKFNYNWAISATLKTADIKVDPIIANDSDVMESNITYSVYRDGVLLESGIIDTSFVVKEAQLGEYVVTAEIDGKESAESNSFIYGEASGLEGIADDFYTGDNCIYSLDGILVGKDGDTSKLDKGIYIMNGKKIIVK